MTYESNPPEISLSSNELTANVRAYADRLLNEDPTGEYVDCRRVGYFMRIYSRQFNGGTLSDPEVVEKLSIDQHDALEEVANAALHVLDTSLAHDAVPLAQPREEYVPIDPETNEPILDMATVFNKVQSMLEVVNQPSPAELSNAEWQKAEDVFNPEGMKFARTSFPEAPSPETIASVRTMLKVAADNFGTIFTGIEFYSPENSPEVRETARYIAQFVTPQPTAVVEPATDNFSGWEEL